MKTVYKKYIRNNWFWINKTVILHLVLIIIGFIALLGILEILCEQITN